MLPVLRGNGCAATPATSLARHGIEQAPAIAIKSERIRPPCLGAFTFFEEPDRSALEARLLWRAELDPTVVLVRATAAPPGDPDGLDLEQLRAFATLARAECGQEYLALSDGWRRLRLDVVEGSLCDGACVRLDYRLSGFQNLELRLQTLRRLAALRRTGHFEPRLHPEASGLPRRLEALQVADGLRAGGSYREIAIALFGEARVRGDWRKRSDYLLSRVRRRAAEARTMLSGGYRSLLCASR